MNILLVNPKQESQIEANLPKYVDENRGHLPPLGLLYVGAILEKEHQVKILDLNVGDKLNCNNVDIVGITANTFTIIDALRTAREIKEKWAGVKIILGGMHPSIFPEETLINRYVDYVFVGEAEETINQALSNLSNNKILQGSLVNVVKLPYPARYLINTEKYYSLLGKSRYITTMFTSRGCPFGCIFCHRRTMGKELRTRTASQVVREMWRIKESGIDEVLIYDDTFTIDKKRVIDICNLIITSRLSIDFDIRTRVDCINEELLMILKRAGCKRIHYGVEASSDRILQALGKGTNILQIEQAFRWTKQLGIETLAYFIIGSPDETEQDIKHTIEYAKKLNPDYCHFAIMTPYPDTVLYKTGIKNNRYEDYWSQFAKEPREDFKAPYWVNNKELIEGYLDKAYKEFYLRPSWIIKESIRTKSIGSLTRKAKAGIRMVMSK